MGNIIIGTLNVNQLGVPMGSNVENPSYVIYRNLDLLIKYIDKFFNQNVIPKIMIINEMKYERNSTHVHTMAFTKFKKVMKEKGYKIILNDYSNANHTLGFITLAITKENLIAHKNTTFYSNARYIELSYKNYKILGLHQDLKSSKFPLVEYVKQANDNLIIIGDLNIDKYSFNTPLLQYENEYNLLISNSHFRDIFGSSCIPTYKFGTRIDYVLVSQNLTDKVIAQYQDNSPRLGSDAFTDHSFLMIELCI